MPRAAGMNRARHHLFAGAAFPRDQHGRFTGSDHLDHIQHRLHARTFGHQSGIGEDRAERFLQPRNVAPRTPVLQRLLNHVDQRVRIHWFRQVVVSAMLQRLHSGFYTGVAGHNDDDQIGIGLFQALLQFEAIHAGHLDVHQRQVPVVVSHFQRLARAGRRVGLVTLRLEPTQQ